MQEHDSSNWNAINNTQKNCNYNESFTRFDNYKLQYDFDTAKEHFRVKSLNSDHYSKKSVHTIRYDWISSPITKAFSRRSVNYKGYCQNIKRWGYKSPKLADFLMKK